MYKVGFSVSLFFILEYNQEKWMRLMNCRGDDPFAGIQRLIFWGRLSVGRSEMAVSVSSNVPGGFLTISTGRW